MSKRPAQPPPVASLRARLANGPASSLLLNDHAPRGDVATETLLGLRRAMEVDPVASACLRLLQSAVVQGLELHRDGKPVALKPAFRTHIDLHYVPFCQDAVAALLAWGVVPVCLSKLGRRATLFGDSSATEPLREQQRKVNADNVFPVVPMMQSLVVRHVDDEDGLTRSYELHHAHKIGDGDSKVLESAVYVMTAPTADGQLQSTMATLAEGGEFTRTLARHALEAEAIRTRQAIVTAVDPKANAGGEPTYDPSQWFVDRESRALGELNAANVDQAHFESLVVASRLADELNKERSERRNKEQQQQQQQRGVDAVGRPPDALPVSLFCAPAGQQVVSGLRAPEARPDLAALVKQRIEQIAVAFSVPSALVSEGARFAQHASTQLWSFNARVHSLAHHLSTLLTQIYQHITKDETAVLVVTPLPLRSTDELLNVFKSGVITRETITPLVMKGLGLGEEAIQAELGRQAADRKGEAAAEAPAAEAPIAEAPAAEAPTAEAAQ